MKKILLGVLAFIVLLVLGVGIYILTFNVNSRKDDFEQALSKKFGLPVSIKGEMEMSKSLTPTLVVRDVEVKNPEGFEGVFLKIGEVDITFDLQAYLKDIISVEKINVKNVNLSLQVNKEGKNNWGGLFKNSKAATSVIGDKPMLSKAGVVAAASLTQVDVITFSNLKVDFKNQMRSMHRVFDFKNVTLERLLNLDGSLIYEKEAFSFSGSIKKLLPLLTTGRNLDFSFDVKGINSSMKLSGLCLELANCTDSITLNVSISGNDFQKAYSFFVNDNVKNLPTTPFDFKSAGQISNNQLVLDSEISFDSSAINGSTKLKYDLIKGSGNGTLELNVLESNFVSGFGLNSFSLQTAYKINPTGQVDFTNLAAMFDETDIDGSFSVLKNGEKFLLKGNLHSYYFKMSNVFIENQMQEELQEEMDAESEDEGIFSLEKIDLSWFNKLDMDIKFSVDTFSTNSYFVRYPTLNLSFVLKDSVLEVRLLDNSSLAEGKIAGKLTINDKQKPPVWNVEFVAENLKINQVNSLKKVFRAGDLNANIFLTSSGDSINSILGSLDGSMAFSSGHMEISSPVVGKLFTADQSNDLFVNCTVLNALVKKGVVTLDKRAALETSRFNMLLNGQIDLDNKQMDLSFIPQKKNLRGEKSEQVLSSISLIGPLNNPMPKIEVLENETLNTTVQEKNTRMFAAELYKKKQAEETSVCRIASAGMQMKTINDYFGRAPKVDETKTVTTTTAKRTVKKQKESLGTQFLDSLSDVLNEQSVRKNK